MENIGIFRKTVNYISDWSLGLPRMEDDDDEEENLDSVNVSFIGLFFSGSSDFSKGNG